jgi:hypothetical protein
LAIIAAPNLNRVLAAYKAEVAAQFDQELPELFHQAVLQIGLRVFAQKGMNRRTL